MQPENTTPLATMHRLIQLVRDASRPRWHDLGKTGYAVPCPGRERCQVCQSPQRPRPSA